jgi:hypothetical protein
MWCSSQSNAKMLEEWVGGGDKERRDCNYMVIHFLVITW